MGRTALVGAHEAEESRHGVAHDDLRLALRERKRKSLTARSRKNRYTMHTPGVKIRRPYTMHTPGVKIRRRCESGST